MHRLERLQAILLKLQSRRLVKAQDLADHFDISLRTVYRDIRALEEAGVPIAAEAGIGYSLVEGYSLPPVQFTTGEAAALLTGEKLLQKLGDQSVNKAFQSAMDKLRSVMKESDKDFIEKLDSSMQVPFNRQSVEGFPNHYLSAVQQALVEQRVIEMEYFTYQNGTLNKREVEPIGICYLGSSWHLIAWCRLRKDFRDFRTDRIKSLRLMNETYRKDDHPSITAYMESTSPQNSLRVVLRFTNRVARFLGEQKYYYGVVDEKQLPEQVEMTFLVPSLHYISGWLLMWHDTVEIVEPDELKAMMKQSTQRLQKHYLS